MKPAAFRWLLDVVADRDGEHAKAADGGEDQLRLLPGEVGDPVHRGSTSGEGRGVRAARRGLYQNSK